ncbi:unnamed protein product [Arctia plantaginis]|uniref:Uncharacterized protein n=1 Tax=Arctia plantaginis TaxID=874455 RepID=A0A8S1A3N3_ARCPL|nr:unnamed protein product [Arctia plantaginis]
MPITWCRSCELWVREGCVSAYGTLDLAPLGSRSRSALPSWKRCNTRTALQPRVAHNHTDLPHTHTHSANEGLLLYTTLNDEALAQV